MLPSTSPTMNSLCSFEEDWSPLGLQTGAANKFPGCAVSITFLGVKSLQLWGRARAHVARVSAQGEAVVLADLRFKSRRWDARLSDHLNQSNRCARSAHRPSEEVILSLIHSLHSIGLELLNCTVGAGRTVQLAVNGRRRR